jgi:hypothetical protein
MMTIDADLRFEIWNNTDLGYTIMTPMTIDTLFTQAEEEGEAPPEDSAALTAVRGLPKASRLPRPGEGYAFLEDPSVRQTSSAVAVMTQLVTLVQLTRRYALGAAVSGRDGLGYPEKPSTPELEGRG